MDVNKVYSEWRWYADEVSNFDTSYKNKNTRKDFNEFVKEFYEYDHEITKEEMKELEENFIPISDEEAKARAIVQNNN